MTINIDPTATLTPAQAAIIQGQDAGGNAFGSLSALPLQIPSTISDVLTMDLPIGTQNLPTTYPRNFIGPLPEGASYAPNPPAPNYLLWGLAGLVVILLMRQK